MNIFEFMSDSPILSAFIVFCLVVGARDLVIAIKGKCDCENDDDRV